MGIDVLRTMITGNWGPYKDYSAECAAECRSLLKFVCDEILSDFLPDDLNPYNGASAEYERDEDCLVIRLEFYGEAPMNAEEIVVEFMRRSNLCVDVSVSEETSRCKKWPE